MNPVYFALAISFFFLVNFLLVLAFCFWSLIEGYITFTDFLDYLPLIIAYPAILIKLYFSFFSDKKEKNFSRITKKVNILTYVIPVTIAVFIASVFFDFGFYADIANMPGVNKIGIKSYFIMYEAYAGQQLGGLFSELFYYLSSLKID